MRNTLRTSAVSFVGLILLSAQQADAVTYNWTGAGGDWETVGNWTPAPPAFTGIAIGNTSLFNVSSGAPITTTNTIFADQLTISTGGTLNVSAARTAYFLHLAGGTLQGSNAASSMSGQLFADPSTTSTISNTLGAGTFTISSQLNGTGTLKVNNPTATTIVSLSNGTLSGTYTGLIDIDSGILRMAASNGLSGGTVQVDNGVTGLFQMGVGFSSGRVNVISGGIAENDVNAQFFNNLHLMGGTFRGGALQAGNGGSSGSKIFVDSASTLLNTGAAASTFTIGSQLNGTGNLTMDGTNANIISLGNNALGTTYSGTITIASGRTLVMGNNLGLSGGTVNVTSTGGLFQVGQGIALGQVNVQTGGIAVNTVNAPLVNNLHLAGGTLQGTTGLQYGNGGSAGSKTFVDSASTLFNTGGAGTTFGVASQLNGSANLTIDGANANTISLLNDAPGTTYSGTITIASGRTLVMGNNLGLSGGTVNVTSTGGLFQVGQGIALGQVNVQTGGIAVNTVNAPLVNNLHLAGGTLQGTSAALFGNGGSAGSKVFVDASSTLFNTGTAGTVYTVSAQLNGSNNLTIDGTNATSIVSLANDAPGTTYSGTITIASGRTLVMGNNLGLSGGTLNVTSTGGLFQVGQGIALGQVNVQTGGIAVNTVNAPLVNNLHLAGGTLQGTTGLQYGNGGSSGSKTFVDSASTLFNTGAAASTFSFASQLNGTGNLTINGTNANSISLLNDAPGTTYSGTITIATGRTLVLGNAQGLSGGTVNLATGSGTFALGPGFATGQVNVQTGGVLLANGASNLSAVSVHLNGGTLQSNAATSITGDNTTGSNIYVDSASTLDSNAQTMNIRARLNGSGALTKSNTGTTVLGLDSSATYDGNVAVNTGTLQLIVNGALGTGNNQLTVASGGAVVNITAGMANTFINLNKLTLGTNTFTFGDPDATQSFSTTSGTVLNDDGVSVNVAPFFTGTAKTINLVASAPAHYTITPGSTDWTTVANWFDGAANATTVANYAGKNFDIGSGKTAQTTSSTPFHDQLNILAGGVLEVNNNGRTADNLHLAGGELRGTVNSATLNGQIFADAATSTTLANNAGSATTFNIGSQLNGSGTMVVNSSNAGAIISLNNSNTATTFSGLIDLDQGIVVLGNANALAGGTVQVDNANGVFRLGGAGFITGRVNVNSGGVVQVNQGSVATFINDMHLNGGRLEATADNAFAGRNDNPNQHSSRLTIDSLSTIKNATTSGVNPFRIHAQLLGAGDLIIDNTDATRVVELHNAASNTSYSGTITVANGILRMGAATGLNGGTVQLDGSNPGVFQLGGNGFSTGRVNVNTGGVAQVAQGGVATFVNDMHLNGGRLEATVDNAFAGRNDNPNQHSSRLTIDSLSTIKNATTSGVNPFRIHAQLLGAGDLIIDNTNATRVVELHNAASNTSYSGTITVANGILRMGAATGLNGGTVQLDGSTPGVFQLGGNGFNTGRVNVNTGGVAQVAQGGTFTHVNDMHLNGGRLEATADDAYAGRGDNPGIYSSRLTIDSTSTIKNATTVGSAPFKIFAQLLGAGDLIIDNTDATRVVELHNAASNTSYSGTITVANGILRMGAATGLNGGTVQLDGSTPGVFQLGGNGFSTGRVNVNTGGVAQVAQGGTFTHVNDMHLNGGRLEATVDDAYAGRGDGANTYSSRLTIDSTSTIRNATTSGANAFKIYAQLIGAGDLIIDNANSTRIVDLFNNATTSSYSGTITVNTGILRMGATTGLNGGTIQVNNGTTGLFRLGAGFSTGRVNVLSGGIAEVDSSGVVAANLHLMGGTLRNNTTTSNMTVGNNSAASRIIVDSDSTLASTGATGSLQVQSQIWGTGKLTVNNTAGLQVYLNQTTAGLENTVSYSGDWDIQSGVLRLGTFGAGNATALLGSGVNVNIASGQQLLLDDLTGNTWTMRKTLTGNGTVQFANNSSDKIVVTRGADNTLGAISPGTAGPGALNFQWLGTPSVSTSLLDFATNASSDRVPWNIQIATSSSYDAVTSNGYLANLSNARLVVDPAAAVVGTMTIYAGASQVLGSGSLAFGSVQFLNSYSGTLTYGTDGTIKLTDVGVMANWTNPGTGTWVTPGDWSPTAVPTGSAAFANVLNGGTSNVTATGQSSGVLVIQNASSTVNVASGGALSVSSGIEVRSGGTLSVSGSLTTPLVNSYATTTFGSGSTGSVTNLNVITGSTTIDNSGVAFTNITAGVANQAQATATLINGAINPTSVDVRPSSSAGTPTKFIIGNLGELVLTNTGGYNADTANYASGRYELDAGGKVRFTSFADFSTFQDRTEWNGGILVIDGTLNSYNNRDLLTNQIVDFGTTGALQSGTSKLFLRGGTIMYGAGYAKDTRLQFTEDLGTLIVSGGALTTMPNTVAASVTLEGALATWTTGNKTFGQGTTLTLKNGAATTTGVGNVLNVDQLTFEGTGGTVNMNNSILVHGANQLSLRNNGLITGSGSILVGIDGLSLGDNGNEGVLNGTGAGFTVFGDISGWGSMGGVTLFGNFSPGSSPGHTTVLPGGVTWTSGSTATYELGGTNQGVPEYDYTTLQGTLTLQPNVTLDVVWINDFTPGYQAVAGDVFELFDIQGGGFSGTFSTILLPTFTNPNLAWDTSDLYTLGEISVYDQSEVEVIPEPSTVVLALLPLAALVCYCLRRRQ